LALAGFAICALQYWRTKPQAQDAKPEAPMPAATSGNPLELGPAAIFAALFIATSLISTWATAQFGAVGIYALAAVIGVSDIDPFVLNLAQGGTSGVTDAALAAAVLIAASSNNMLKAFYAVAFGGGRTTSASAAVLIVLAIAGVAIAIFMAMALA
jgi:uncharacterized membrane protein (DUF4010 family)